MTNLIILIVVAAVLAFDLYLVLTRQLTISYRYQALFPTWFDLCLMAEIIFFVNLIPGLTPFTRILLGVIAGHLFWPNKERFR